MDPSERYIARIDERDGPGLLDLNGRLLEQPELISACGRFTQSVLGGAPVLDGATQGPGAREGAAAIRDLLGAHPAIAGGRRLRVVAGVLGPREPDPAEHALRGDAADFLLVGMMALLDGGPLDDRLVRGVVEIAVGADAFSRFVRDIVLGGRGPQDFLDIEDLIPARLIDLKQLERYACSRAITGAAYAQALPSPGSSWSTGIASLDPPVACAGAHLTIRGSGFKSTKPADVVVLFPARGGGCVAATVVSWSDTAVEVIVPDDAAPGCVGFGSPGRPGDVAAASDLAGALEMCIGPAAFNAAGRIRQLAGAPLPPPCPPCRKRGANRFTGGPPMVDAFLANNSVDVTVEPGTALTLSWNVRNAQTVTLTRTGPAGPAVPGPAQVAASGSLSLGPFAGTSPVTAGYRLTATNACGTITRQVTVRLMRTPALAIARMEVVQVIQKPDNSVRLTAGKRTVVRVFVDSGVSDGFDWGSGPNVVPGLTGTVLSFPAGRGFGATATRVGTSTAVARATGTHNRNLPGDALMFELPLADTTGQVRIEARIAVAGHEQDVGGPWKASGSVTVDFINRPTQLVLPMLVADPPNGFPAPTIAAFNTSLQEARKRYPLAESAYIVNPPVPLSLVTFGKTYDLSNGTDWSLFLGRIMMMVFIGSSTPTGGVRCALVPRNAGGFTRPDGTMIPGYAFNGMASPRVGGLSPGLVAQSALTGTFAHEFGHCVGFGHAPCPPPPGTPGTLDCSDPPDGLDARLPGRTDDVGVDVPAAAVIPTGRGEMMSYCGDSSRCPGTTRWPSIAGWDLLFDTLPI